MKNSKIIIISLLVMGMMSLTSCLKDLEDFIGDFSSSPAIAELSEAASAATGTVNREIKDPTAASADFVLKVNIASVNPLGKDTKVTLALDNSLLLAYNADRKLHGADSARPLPAAAIVVPSFEVTIPAGEREADFKYSIKPNLVTNFAGLAYIVPVKIVSADNGVVVSGNYNTKLVRFLARNKFDGVYTVTGTFVDYVYGPDAVGVYPKTVHLITTGGYTVDKYDFDQDYYGYIFDFGGLSGFGNWTPYFKFDASDNVVDVINSTTDPAPRSRTAVLYTGAGSINKFNAATRTLDITYQMKQMTVTPNLRNLITEHYTFVSVRP